MVRWERKGAGLSEGTKHGRLDRPWKADEVAILLARMLADGGYEVSILRSAEAPERFLSSTVPKGGAWSVLARTTIAGMEHRRGIWVLDAVAAASPKAAADLAEEHFRDVVGQFSRCRLAHGN